jgi:8-oxo-dGTP diphosphatase
VPLAYIVFVNRIRVCGLLEGEEGLLVAGHKGYGPLGELWIPPGGGLEERELIYDCLVREFAEETGLTVVVGAFAFCHQVLTDRIQAIELFYYVHNLEIGREPVLGVDPEYEAEAQVLIGLQYVAKSYVLADTAGMYHAVVHEWALGKLIK